MRPSDTTPGAWVLSDGAAGNENQAIALARALGLDAEVLRLSTRAPWRWLAPRLVFGAERAFGDAFALRLRGDLPQIAIGCGRHAALATRILKRCGGDAIRCVQILDPRIDPRVFDLVIAPEHDGLRGDNVLATLGALNSVDDAWLEQARTDWPALVALPGPRTLLLLGGPNRALQLDADYWRGLAAHIATLLARDGGSLLVSSSRRTPAWLRDAARNDLADLPGVQWHGPDDGPNPYAGFLAAADRIVVTPDSVNLLSEACATRAPVWIHQPVPLTGKIGGFVARLRECGRVQILGDDTHIALDVEPLRETARIAADIRARLQLPR